MGPAKGCLFKLDSPSAKFWVKIFFEHVGLRWSVTAPGIFLGHF